MKIESRAYSKAAAKEFVRISASSVKLIKSPKGKLGDNISMSLIILICCIVGFLVCIVIGNFVNDALINFWAGAFITMGILLFFYRLRLKKIIAALMNPNRLTVFTFDNDGLETDDSQKVIIIKWGAFQGYRVFKHTLVLIPKSVQGQMIVFTIDKKDELERFFEENKIDMIKLG